MPRVMVRPTHCEPRLAGFNMPFGICARSFSPERDLIGRFSLFIVGRAKPDPGAGSPRLLKSAELSRPAGLSEQT